MYSVSSIKRVWLVAMAYWVIVSALVCWLYPVMVYDPTARYAPMADAFAHGDWFFAYHPRFGVLFTTLAGCVAYLTGFRGDHACQIVSIGFLAFSVIPVWMLVKRVWQDERVAWIAAALLLLATEYFVYAEDGLRDTARIFGLACCALSFVSLKPVPLALGLFSLVTLRTDLFVISAVILFAWWSYLLVLRFRPHPFSSLTYPSSFLLTPSSFILPISSFLLGAFLMCLMTHSFTGLWLPGAQFVKYYLKLTGGSL